MKITKYAKSFSAAMVLALVPVCIVGCSKKPVAPEPEPVRTTRGVYFGLWEGKDRNGDVYSIRFTDTTWESRVEKEGVSMPYYKGTYTHTGTRLDLVITEEADLMTMGWRTQRGNLGPNITGRLSGRALSIAALTEISFVKKQ
jgi:hypothetical protein